MSKLMIGITEGRRFELYAAWIKGNDDVEIIPLSYQRNNADTLGKCSGIVFTGGEDVHPKYYHRVDDLVYCNPSDISEQRDAFEWELLTQLQKNPLPLLGICRGLQMVNVFYDGTLIPDIVTWGKFSHTKFSEGKDRYHKVIVDEHSALKNIVNVTEGIINSAHHQSADKIGKGLAVSALSVDGVVEAIERKDGSLYNSFLCLVQWHPERMEHQESPLAQPLRKKFIEEVQKFQHS